MYKNTKMKNTKKQKIIKYKNHLVPAISTKKLKRAKHKKIKNHQKRQLHQLFSTEF